MTRIQSFKFLAIVFYFLFLVFGFANATVLYFEPVSGEYYLEDTFIVKVKLDTGEEEINALQININFPQDLLEVKDFSKGNSLLTFWLEEADFSNKTGEINFTGGIPRGYQGDGVLGKIIFKVRGINAKQIRETNAKLEFLENSQVLLNDGLGTLAELTIKEAIFTILPEKLEIPKNEWQEMLKEDNVPPEPFEIIISQDPFLFDGQHFIVFFTRDEQAGIDYYQIKEGEMDWKLGESPYLLEDQGLKSIIKVRAVDKAGNEIIVEYLPERQTFPWRTIAVILTAIALFCWIFKKLKPKAKNEKLQFKI